jgi:hypothetical protein
MQQAAFQTSGSPIRAASIHCGDDSYYEQTHEQTDFAPARLPAGQGGFAPANLKIKCIPNAPMARESTDVSSKKSAVKF